MTSAMVPTLAKKPDTATLSAKLAMAEMTEAEVRAALHQCVEYIEHVEMALEDLRDKCAETARLLR